MEKKIDGATVVLVQGDITEETTDAIVNAANEGLRGGGGVDGAIHRAGGPAIMEECRKIGYCPTGQAVVTTGGNLKARYVIHTVGPVYRGGNKGEAKLLESAYRQSLERASEKGLKSLSFPAISMGVYGYPPGEGARIALRTVMAYLKEHKGIERVRFVLFDRKTFDVFKEALEETA
ncbi:MAG TPA: O-acetyl-ADP-ribose deacetylase [Syntrophales bacterium]|nr:O-acetyl-ADP-ribose deacetylase [Syntrophales bacterium]HQB31171.1 O-acetyl-ADP-ribose deacetylase [Syntrophales bacterium]HQN77853.1 O-acetyl-ADP-ribose deacetylase [Syntrophales bacterium]HQQ27020.1 O-acetyl-ADP-ribose deacetylase [Syntrophales bacterium]